MFDGVALMVFEFSNAVYIDSALSVSVFEMLNRI